MIALWQEGEMNPLTEGNEQRERSRRGSILRRGLACIALVVIFFLLLLLLFFAFTGGKPEYLLAILFCLIVVPVVVYVMLWITRLFK